MEVSKFTDLLGSGYVMVVGNYQCNAANLNQSKAQFQLELSLAQLSPSLFSLCLRSSMKIPNFYRTEGYQTQIMWC